MGRRVSSGPLLFADVAELVDALDLGSSGVTRGGSSPLIRTIAPKIRVQVRLG